MVADDEEHPISRAVLETHWICLFVSPPAAAECQEAPCWPLTLCDECLELPEWKRVVQWYCTKVLSAPRADEEPDEEQN